MNRYTPSLLCAALLLGCGDPTSASHPPEITTSIALDPAVAVPGGKARVAVTAAPARGAFVERIELSATGLTTFSRTRRVNADSAVTTVWDLDFPVGFRSDSVRLRAVASGEGVSGSADALLLVQDNAPPALAAATTDPAGAVQVGVSVAISFTAVDDEGLVATVVRWSGGVSGLDSVAVFPRGHVSRSVVVAIPDDAPLTDALRVTVKLIDVGGNSVVQELGPVAFIDTFPPRPSGFGTTNVVGPFIPGDTMVLTLNVFDRGVPRVLGWFTTPPLVAGDSVTLAPGVTQAHFPIVFDSSWIGTHRFQYFAEDAAGNRGQTDEIEQPVFDAARYPTDVIALGAQVTDAVEDQARGRMYLAQPELERIAVLDLSQPSLLAPIELPSPGHGIDLTPSGDTLLVTLRTQDRMLVLDVSADPLVVDSVAFPSNDVLEPADVRVLSNDKALVALSYTGSGFAGEMWEYDLTSQTAMRRLGVGVQDHLSDDAPLARSADRSRLLIFMEGACCPAAAQVYSAPDDAFGILAETIFRSSAAISVDETGERLLIGNELYDPLLTRITTLTHPDTDAGSATVIDAAGTTVFLGTEYGFIALSDTQELLQKAVLPRRPERLMLAGGDALLVSFAGEEAAIVTLP